MKNAEGQGNSQDRGTESLYPDVLLPTQFYISRRGRNLNEPIRALVVAVLQDAIRNFERNIHARTILRRRTFLNAERWFFAKNASDDFFSFETVCETLDLQPNRIRRAISAWRTKTLAGGAQPLLGNLMCHKTKRGLKSYKPHK
jgi:hypothetical protein